MNLAVPAAVRTLLAPPTRTVPGALTLTDSVDLCFPLADESLVILGTEILIVLAADARWPATSWIDNVTANKPACEKVWLTWVPVASADPSPKLHAYVLIDPSGSVALPLNDAGSSTMPELGPLARTVSTSSRCWQEPPASSLLHSSWST